MVSMDVLQMVERKNPKLIPARPASIQIMSTIIVKALTLEKCENYKPRNGTTAGQLEDEEDSDQCYSRLDRYNQKPPNFVSNKYLNHHDHKL